MGDSQSVQLESAIMSTTKLSVCSAGECYNVIMSAKKNSQVVQLGSARMSTKKLPEFSWGVLECQHQQQQQKRTKKLFQYPVPVKTAPKLLQLLSHTVNVSGEKKE